MNTTKTNKTTLNSRVRLVSPSIDTRWTLYITARLETLGYLKQIENSKFIWV